MLQRAFPCSPSSVRHRCSEHRTDVRACGVSALWGGRVKLNLRTRYIYIYRYNRDTRHLTVQIWLSPSICPVRLSEYGVQRYAPRDRVRNTFEITILVWSYSVNSISVTMDRKRRTRINCCTQIAIMNLLLLCTGEYIWIRTSYSLTNADAMIKN